MNTRIDWVSVVVWGTIVITAGAWVGFLGWLLMGAS